MRTSTLTSETHCDTTSPIRALHSLCKTQVASIVTGLGSLAGTWDMEHYESCDGHLSLVLTHTTCDTVIIVGRDSKGIHVSLMLSDELHTIPERHTSIANVVTVLKDLAGKTVVAMQKRCA
jgi:hypothetical protein